MSITNHSISIWIDGVDKSSSLLKDSLFVRLRLKNNGSSAEFTLKNYTPPERAEVNIYVNSILVFGGYIVRRNAQIVGVKGSSSIRWKCECSDWNELLTSVKVNADYVNQSDAFIINNLFTTYLSFDLGFDGTTNVVSQASLVNISFVDCSLVDALNQLSKQVGANWFIQADKKLNWFNRNSGQAASFGISSSPNNSTTFGFLNNSLDYSVDSSTIINQVKIQSGVTSNGSKQTETFTGNGTQKTFNLTQIPNSVVYVSYNDGGNSYVTYGSFVGYEPQDKLISKSGSYLVVVNQQQKSITLEGNTGLAPGNGTTVTVEYYQKELISTEYNNQLSQDLFGVYSISLDNKEFVSIDQSQDLAENILEQNAYGKATLKFDTTKYGLLPGQLVTIDVSEMDIVKGWQFSGLSPEEDGHLLAEDFSYLITEQFALGKDFLVQEIALQPVVTAQNQFMLVCQVTCGTYLPDLIDALATVSELRSSRGIESQNPIPTRLSNVSTDLGEVQLGRAVFTDGGTARFNWGTPNAASGVVIGLEDRSALEGALYIYDEGTARVKLGKLDDRPAIGTVQPTGWGIYTDNGYFRGVVYASQLIGGTVSGSLISGGTVSGQQVVGGTITGGWIEGGTIQAADLIAANIAGGTINSGVIYTSVLNGADIYGGTITGGKVIGGTVLGNTIIGGTIATGTPPINSSNPGVLMDATGLYGYGSAGLTFRLSSDPAIKPYFSSGTILNATYEITTQSVLRTGTTNPRVQIDNSGIFAYNSSGVAKFTIDVATGRLTASDGIFSGSISASSISGGTISAPVINGALLSGGLITGNAIEANTITGNQITGGTITGGYISGGTVTGALISGGTIRTGSGSVSLDSNGVIFTQPGSGYSAQSALKWNRSGNTQIYISARFDGTYNFLDSIAGINGSQEGRHESLAYGTTSSTYTNFIQQSTNFGFWNVVSGSHQLSLNVDKNEIGVYRHIIPWPTYQSDINLGSTTVPFKYLFLRSDDNNIWRLSVSNAGVLVITDV